MQILGQISEAMSATGGMGGADPEVLAAIERGNAVVFFDIALGEGQNTAELGRIKLELFVKDVSLFISFASSSLLCHCSSQPNMPMISTLVSKNMREFSTAVHRRVPSKRTTYGILGLYFP